MPGALRCPIPPALIRFSGQQRAPTRTLIGHGIDANGSGSKLTLILLLPIESLSLLLLIPHHLHLPLLLLQVGLLHQPRLVLTLGAAAARTVLHRSGRVETRRVGARLVA